VGGEWSEEGLWGDDGGGVRVAGLMAGKLVGFWEG